MKHSDQIVLDLQVGRQLRDEGMARVLDHTPDEWKNQFEHAIEVLAAKLESFTVVDVRLICGDPPGHPNAFGAMMGSALKRGLIKQLKDDPIHSPRPSAHGRKLIFYIGVP